MLRVQSILYIERLWSSPHVHHKQYASYLSSSEPAEVQVVQESEDLIQQIQALPKAIATEQVLVQEDIPAMDTTAEADGNQAAAMTTTTTTVTTVTTTEAEADKDIPIGVSEIIEVTEKQAHSESGYNTGNEIEQEVFILQVEDKPVLENMQVEEESVALVVDTQKSSSDEDNSQENEEITSSSPVLANTSIISSGSSLSPVTPTSIDSPLELRPTSTRNSIFRRETTKLNHKRKTLTKKLKKVLSHPTKRTSV
ncbi:hypothetical protein G6F70_005101 [Rhizopus microsporus]|uniref:Uncharacterized protein n=1 Tax=Rhizopus azygosporus TaxID=86630 RepID=A0A367J417_RHIAZ|nr:hypothetical protein G6F71_000063 [Rhizopus microsporus]RCH84677.1 hypothetical protein CU097_002181 [Rhizopus azygosporus]KAG1199245.1 hypothetical protein G6F70_005101 [Rhizopus microsporus]KAG1211070.1 hypothetical protein G6F69_004919 [Rhizopus microsporus]KAG1232885.1 hypothetical protein G6F67_004683 [Rhizopus microsporus]